MAKRDRFVPCAQSPLFNFDHWRAAFGERKVQKTCPSRRKQSCLGRKGRVIGCTRSTDATVHTSVSNGVRQVKKGDQYAKVFGAILEVNGSQSEGDGTKSWKMWWPLSSLSMVQIHTRDTSAFLWRVGEQNYATFQHRGHIVRSLRELIGRRIVILTSQWDAAAEEHK
ncbi:hypothetical protein BKA93DRAFT_879445 [Sparassis latifolia]